MPNHVLALVMASVLAQNASAFAQSAAGGAGSEAGPRQVAEDPAAEEPEPLVSVGADLISASAFVWRGFVVCDSVVLQPDLWLKVGPLTVSSWVNVATRPPLDKRLTEHDLTVDYSYARAGYTLSAGWINYAFLDVESGRWSNEVYAAVSRDGLLSPSLTVFHDFQQASGTYVSLGVEHAFVLPRGVEVAPNASLGYNRRFYTPYAAFSDAVVGVRVSVPTPVEHLVLQPFVAYSRGLDDRITGSRFYWGVGAAIASH